MISLPVLHHENPPPGKTARGTNLLGLVIPFQPSMVDVRSLRQVQRYALEVIQAKLESKNESSAVTSDLVRRLERIFSKLDYHSRRKSVAILMNADDDMVIYLNFSGQPVFLTEGPFSLLDLVGSSSRQQEFELLTVSEGAAGLYEYFNNRLHLVFSANADPFETGSSGRMVQEAAVIAKLLNPNSDKPVFIYAEDGLFPDGVRHLYPDREITFPIQRPAEITTSGLPGLLAEKINSQWPFWRSQLVRGQIAIAERSERLFSHLNTVATALRQGVNGLLLVDRLLKDEIHEHLEKETSHEATRKLTGEIETFLNKGNRLEITEGGLLERRGGIVLIKEPPNRYEPLRRKRVYEEEDFTF